MRMDFVKTYFLIISILLSFDGGIYGVNIFSAQYSVWLFYKLHIFAGHTHTHPQFTRPAECAAGAHTWQVKSIHNFTPFKTIETTNERNTEHAELQAAVQMPGAQVGAPLKPNPSTSYDVRTTKRLM